MELITTSFPLVESTYAAETKPEKHYNNYDILLVDSDPHRISYLKFNAGCVDGTIHTVKLKLPVDNGSDEGGVVSKTTCDWAAEDINYNNKPERLPTSRSVSIGEVEDGILAEVHLTSLFEDSSETMICLGIYPASDNGADYKKEGLVLDVTCNIAQPTFTPTATPTVSSLPSQHPSVTSSPTASNFPSSHPSLTTSAIPSAPPTVVPSSFPTGSPSFSPTAAPTSSPTKALTVTLPLYEGTYVAEKKPNKHYDGRSDMLVDGDPLRIAYLKFDAECVAGQVQSMILKLPVKEGSEDGGVVSKATSDWVAEDVDWNNKPASIGGPVSIGQVVSGERVEIPLTNYHLETGEKMIALRIDPSSNDGADYFKEFLVLEVTYGGPPVQGCDYTSHLEPYLIEEEFDDDTYNPPDDPNGYFMMKLYWQEGYTWQEDPRETRWCVDCADDCSAGGVYIRECNYKRDRQKWRYFDGKLESLEGPGYCMSYEEPRNDFWLEMVKCGQAKRFTGIKVDGDKFEWHPEGRSDRCVTNTHHPRGNEGLKFNDCKAADRDDTELWVTGDGWQSLGGYPDN